MAATEQRVKPDKAIGMEPPAVQVRARPVDPAAVRGVQISGDPGIADSHAFRPTSAEVKSWVLINENRY
jgi:hypothetical protein